MNTKIELLSKSVFKNFITGKYGQPKIPTVLEVERKVKELTDDDYDPITPKPSLTDIDINAIHDTFYKMVHDLDILYSSVDAQSKEILDQLTNSLKEHNLVKLQLNNIIQRADDISAGKMGKDYMQYVHTDNFSNNDFINDKRTTTDLETNAPIIDYETSQLYIPSTLANIINLTHYYDRKLDISLGGYVGNVVSANYLGDSNAEYILNPVNYNDKLVYMAKLDRPSPVRMSFLLQLDSSRKSRKINNVQILLDQENNNKSFVKLMYKVDTGWRDVPTIDKSPIKEIDKDKIVFQFYEIETTHLKFEFVKEIPDILDSNEYFLSIKNISVFSSETYKSSTYYSKSIKLEPYANEKVIIGNIVAEGEGSVPVGCTVDVSVAKDKRIQGYFVDVFGNYTYPDSFNTYEFIMDVSGIYPDRHVLLSQIKENPHVSGVNNLINQDYDWTKVKSFDESDNLLPSIINVIGNNTNNVYDHSLFSEHPIVWGDVHNSPPSGWLFNQINPIYERIIRFGDVMNAIHGWYRPQSSIITPSGISDQYFVETGNDKYEVKANFDPLPDFYINGIKFYSIYRFTPYEDIVDSTIKLYNYPSKPLTEEGDDYYPHNMVWNYNTNQVIKTITISTNKVNPFTENLLRNERITEEITLDQWRRSSKENQLPPPGSGTFELPLPEGGEIIQNSIRNVTNIGSSNVLQEGFDYDVKTKYDEDDKFLYHYIDLEPAVTFNSERYINGLHLNVTYSYVDYYDYTSFWKGYIISESDNKEITINNEDDDNNIIINKVILRGIDNDTEEEIVPSSDTEESNSNITINIDSGTYELIIYCLSDHETKKPKKDWNPYDESNIILPNKVRLVSTITPLNIINFDALLHSTTYENDNRAAILSKPDGYKYLVVKEPSKNIIPGYFYNFKTRVFENDEQYLIKNIGHYNRSQLIHDAVSGTFVQHDYITGSNNSAIMSGVIFDGGEFDVGEIPYDISSYEPDRTWNNGSVFPDDWENTSQNFTYPTHLSFGYPINVDDEILNISNPDYYTLGSKHNMGHLFYNTGENLPAFYTIKYAIVDKYDPTVDRFLYKVDLVSEHKTNTPVLDWLKFTTNVYEEEFQ